MRRFALSAALMVAMLHQAQAGQSWWSLGRSSEDDPIWDKCDDARDLKNEPSPAAAYERMQELGWENIRIQDDGDEVDLYYTYFGIPGKWFYFRTLAACQTAAQANINAAQAAKDKLDEAAKAKKDLLDKYR